MDPKKRKTLEKAGWKIGDAADFLRMSEAERKLLDARVKRAISNRQKEVDDSELEIGGEDVAN